MCACIELGPCWHMGEGGQGRVLAHRAQGTGQGGCGHVRHGAYMGHGTHVMGTWVVVGHVGTWHGRVMACQGVGASGAGCGAQGMGHHVALWHIGMGTSVKLKR